MSNKLSLADVAKIIGISVPAAANREREGSLPYVRISERSGEHYFTDPASAVIAFRAGKQTGYAEADTRAQEAAMRVVERKTEAAKIEARRLAREKYDAQEAIKARIEKSRSDALTAAANVRYV
jgi:hypothetical protein